VSSHALLGQYLAHAPDGGVGSIARLLDGAASSVAIFERTAGEVRIVYLNRAAAEQAAVSADAAIGRPLTDAFPQVDVAFVDGLFDQVQGEPARPLSFRGLMPGGTAWTIDAVSLGPDRLLVMAEQLGDVVSARNRLEALVGAMDAIWRPTDFASMANRIVEQAQKLFARSSIVLCTLDHGTARELRVVAATPDLARLIGHSVAENTVAARAAADAQTMSVALPADEAVVSADAQPEGPHSVRVVPLFPGARLPDGRTSLGVLVVMRAGASAFTEAEQGMMDEFAKLVSLAAHRAELLADARISAHHLQLTLDLAMAFASSNSPRAVIQLLLSRTVDAAEADRATLSRIEGDELIIEATYARSGELTWVGRRYSLDWLDSQPLVKEAVETGKPVVGGRLDARAAAPEFRDALSEVRRTATLPLMLGGKVAGTLVVSRVQDREFEGSDISVLELMGNAAMLALRNARLVEDLQVANAAKSEFLNLAAHELRTPVTVISGYTSMLQTGTLDGAEATMTALKVIEDKAGELARLVDGLLHTARLRTPSRDVELREFDCTASVRAAVDRAAAFANLAGGSIALAAPDGGSLTALGEPELVARVLDNLLNNAVAYSDGPPRVTVTVTANERHVDIDVADDGRGIPASYHTAVFDEFVRVDDASGRGGAGLGLHIARRLARAVGGEVSLVRSAPREGSLFRLRLVRP